MIVLSQACADDCPLKKSEALRECTVKPATKTCNLLPNELNSDVARFTSHVPTCLATIQVVQVAQIRSQYSGNLQQPNMLQDRLDSWVVKNAFCVAAMLQNELKALLPSFYRNG